MNAQDDFLRLEADWPRRAETQQQAAAKFRALVNGLADFDRAFEIWKSKFQGKKFVLQAPITSDDAVRVTAAAQTRNDEPANLWPELGWTFMGSCSGAPPWPSGYRGEIPMRIHFGVTADLPLANVMSLLVSARRYSTDSPWPNAALRRLLGIVVTVWGPNGASIFPSDFERVEAADPSSGTGMKLLAPRLGWITYLPADIAGQVRLPPGMFSERTPDGGVIVSVTDGALSASDPEQLRRMRAFEAAMRPLQN